MRDCTPGSPSNTAFGLSPGSCPSRRRGITNAQLYARLALEPVYGDVAGDVQRTPARVQEEIAEWLADTAERDAVDELAVARSQPQANVVFPDRIDIRERMRGQREDRLGVARAVPPRPGTQLGHLQTQAPPT